MKPDDLQHCRDLPNNANARVFHAPWQAQAFAMAVQLQRQELFSPGEWAEQLGNCIRDAQARGDADLGDTYYDHWIVALEVLLTSKGLISRQSLESHRLAIVKEQSRQRQHEHNHYDHHH
jgi:nitrile hydratase accessory protein